MKALVVDDDAFVRAALNHQLKLLGVQDIFDAGDGAEAASTLRARGPFDLIVLDLQMPGTDGIELLRMLSGIHETADVILTSSLDQKLLGTAAALARAHGLHLLGTVRKPVTLQALRELLARHSADRSTRAVQAAFTAEQLAAALGQRQIRPYFQPKVRATDGKLVSVEALARWIHPELGLVAPARFIPLAESAGLIDELTGSIFSQAIAWLPQWDAAGRKITLEINVSAASLTRVRFPDEATAIAAAVHIPCHRIVFEITESTLMADLARSLDTLSRLRLRGFKLAVDDFGTGHSTFTQLKQLPVSELKFDQSFVGAATRDPEARAIVESSQALARQFRLLSVAEGVEDAPTAELMRELGVDLLQGYHYARPMPGEALPEWWRGH